MKAFLRERFGNLDATGRFWMWLGIITLAVSMGMAYDYGSQVSFKHGVAMGVLSLATAFIFEEAHRQWQRGMKFAAGILCVVAIPLFWQETKSHIAYTAGFRGINIETADLAKARYTNATNNVDERKNLLDKKLSDLAKLEAANDWAVTTTATALRAQLDSAQKAIDLETSRGGCKAKCLGLMQQKADLEGRIAKAEERSTLNKDIADLKAELAQVRDKADKVEHKPSIVQHQNTTLNKLAALIAAGTIDPTPMMKEVVEQENTVGLALMPVILPALFFSLMGLYRREDDVADIATSFIRPERNHSLIVPVPRLQQVG